MSPIRHTLSILACGALALWMADRAVSAPAAAPIVLDGFAASVNDRTITLGDVLMTAAGADRAFHLRLEGEALEKKLDENYQKALEILIGRALILEEARRRDLKVQDRAVDDYINNLIHERFANNRTAFLQMLAEEKLTLPEYREQTRDSLVAMLLRRQEVQSRVVVPPHDLRTIYEQRLGQYRTPEQVHLRVLTAGVKRDAESTPDRLQQRAETARQRIRDGASFEEVARATSDGPGATAGGDWGWMPPTDLRPELQAAVARLKPGEISPVIAAEGVYFVLQLVERKAPDVRPFEQVRGDLEKELRQAEEERLFTEWITELKNRHYVRVFIPQRPR